MEIGEERKKERKKENKELLVVERRESDLTRLVGPMYECLIIKMPL